MRDGKMERGMGPCIGCGRLTGQEFTFDRQAVRVCMACETGQGIRCPVQCGRCCAELWDRVVAPAGRPRGALAIPRPRDDDRMPDGQCPHQGATGCQLDRQHMPSSCKLWVCELGLRVLWGMLTLEQAEVIVGAAAQWDPRQWFDLVGPGGGA